MNEKLACIPVKGYYIKQLVRMKGKDRKQMVEQLERQRNGNIQKSEYVLVENWQI